MTHCDPYPTYSRGERIADGAVHVAGIVFAIVGTVLLILWASEQTTGMIAGLWVYGAALIASFVASFCYHFTPWEGPRPVLRRIDHAAIYLKIAGTYTPLVVLIGSAFAYGILAVVWGLAALGVAMKLFFWGRPTRWGVGLYLGLGWISLALATSLVPLVSGAVMGLIVAGGLVYSAGAVLFSLEGLKYQNAIWHSFVLIASVCFFAAIALGVFAPA
ncbi:hemolysin III family protein [Octadecabacter sp. G9-8]|uniref:Hemolysin III family protein n=1 Tax=Octadecabacter dasysiphoniae TaxID=2909341 RepID=A0ABS9D2B2_9RHOB|nr:hemolysin III family protein [Octadecabacter dasysiphoniae]MCF2872448.1 hemolysin III family protein [Octadecabacter dasysiphoniae]